MSPALTELRALLEDLARQGTTVMALARGGRPQEPWRLYPDEWGIYDRRTRCQFYYHSHGTPGEAGHIHTVRLFPDRTAHLVAISLTEDGWPQALFTVNFWATGDSPEPAEALKRYARAFRIAEDRGEPRLVRFVNLVYRAFLPEIEQLQDEKWRTLEAHGRRRPEASDPYEDRALEVLSRVPIDLRAPA